MRERKLALTCAHLNSPRSHNEILWRNEYDDMRPQTRAAFGAHSAIAETAPRAAHSRDGAKNAADIMARVTKRAQSALQRNALDLQRLSDLQARMDTRHGQAERRRWFVLGRLLANAADASDHWQSVMTSLFAAATLSRADRRALKLDDADWK